MRLRTQAELMVELRAVDPETALTPYALRRMVLSGKIPVVRSGRRMLIDADKLEQYLSQETPNHQPEIGKIRPLSV